MTDDEVSNQHDRTCWKNDFGRTERGEVNALGRMVRRRWMRCIRCSNWYFSRDTVNDRMCAGCGGGQKILGLRNEPKPADAAPPSPPKPVDAAPKPQKSHGRTAGRRVLVEGKEFPTIRAARRALGISLSALGRRLTEKKPGYRYLD